MKVLKYIICGIAISLPLVACTSVNFDKSGSEIEGFDSSDETPDEEILRQQKRLQIEEDMKEVDISKTVVYVDKPVYYPVEEKPEPKKGTAAAKDSTASAIQQAQKYVYGCMYYDFDKDFTYEIYCQPYRVTDLMLEPGEQVIEMPFLSEEKVWEIGAGVSREGGQDCQHFFIKPAYSGLVTSFIIITDRRTYHILLKSFKDVYMTQVKWEYPNTRPFNLIKGSLGGNTAAKGTVGKISSETFNIDPRYLSFDYKMSYPLFGKPYWLPYRVYDDGAKTYITMNETVLHMTTPILLNKRNERINYHVHDNLIIIDELIEKVTLRINHKKVVIKKKNYKAEHDEEAIENAALRDVKNAENSNSGSSAVQSNRVNPYEGGLHMPVVKPKVQPQVQDVYAEQEAN